MPLSTVGALLEPAAVFCKPFTAATVRYFDQGKAEEALRWVTEGVAQSL